MRSARQSVTSDIQVPLSANDRMRLQLKEENEKRTRLLNAEFDPITGKGAPCHTNRVLLKIKDYAIPEQWVPEEMMRNSMIKGVVKAGSIKAYINSDIWGDCRPSYHDIELCIQRVRHKYDFVYWAFMCIRIKHKKHRPGMPQVVPFKLNYAQVIVFLMCESMRLAGVPIDLIIVKARQWGGSTFCIFYQAWILFKHDVYHSFAIVAHIGTASRTIMRMLQKAIELYPSWDLEYPNGGGFVPEGTPLKLVTIDQGTTWVVKDGEGRQVIPGEIYIGTAENPDTIRSKDVSGAHYSETAIWPDTPEKRSEDIIADITGGMDPAPLSMVVKESSAKGAGFFQDEYDAAANGLSSSKPVFIPWMYNCFDVMPIMNLDAFIDYLIAHKDDNEACDGWLSPGKYYWMLWEMGATLQGINWYRYKERSVRTRAAIEHEAPSTVEEAFRSSGNIVFDQYDVARLRKGITPPAYEGDLISRGAKNEDILKGIRYIMREGGPLKIWDFPDKDANISDRYLVVVDVGGRSRNADWSVIRVFDRFMMTFPGGKAEIVAQMRYHTDHDLLAWDAVRVAEFYNHALLVIESNTLETRDRERDVDGNMTDYILDLVAGVYNNLYARENGKGEDITPGAPRKWGFHTNVDTKPKLIANMQVCLRDRLWVEKDKCCCDEIGMYEKNERGQFGAPVGKGKHDDVLMATAIGLWICFNEMPAPQWVEEKGTIRVRDRVSSNSMATF